MNDTILNEWNGPPAKLQQVNESDRTILEDQQDQEEFIRELESRGLIASRRPSRWTRLTWIVKAPFRFAARMLKRLAWHLYVKVQHKRAVKKSLERWQKLAGVGEKSDQWLKWNARWREHKRLEAQRLMLEKPATNAAAVALHNEIIRNTVLRLPLPPPDVDDLVAPVVVLGESPTAECMLMSESDMRLPLSTSVIPPKE